MLKLKQMVVNLVAGELLDLLLQKMPKEQLVSFKLKWHFYLIFNNLIFNNHVNNYM